MGTTTQLKRRMAHGGVYVAAGRLGFNACRFARILVLARFLSPSDFGIFSVCLLLRAFLEAISEGGLRFALIQRRTVRPRFLNVVWTFNIFRGMLAGVVLTVGTPAIGWFFSLTGSALVFPAMGLNEVIKGFTNTGLIKCEKELNFRKLTVVQVATEAVALIVGIGLAVWLRNVWALVGGTLAGTLTTVLLSYAVHSFRPRLDFNLTRLWLLFRFGKWVMGNNVLSYLLNQTDNLLVGYFRGDAALGLYSMAYQLARLPIREVSSVFSRVLFPALTQIQGTRSEVRDVYLRSLYFKTLLTFPMAAGIALLAKEIPVVLGSQWAPVVTLVQMFALLAAIISIGSSTTHAFLAIGKPRITTSCQTARLLILVCLAVPLGQHFGLMGFALAALLSEMITINYLVIMVCLELKMKITSFLHAQSQSFICTMAMGLSWWLIEPQLRLTGMLEIAAGIPICVAIFAVAVIATDQIYHQRPGQAIQRLFFSQS